ncbi:MAG: 16S rRNA (cytidine(1402)-2'-O)-methyltransferase [Spartobacteria bacterium]|nr:16S rRNA (cytidine(1402)-2'-O)-methyltransferase [Spartobacteria bacterium]
MNEIQTPSGLYIVATPIGNLADITLRALQILRDVDFIVAEDTRHSLKLLNHYEIKKKCYSCHQFNEASRIDRIKDELGQNRRIALLTDAGTPCISDPGSRLVHAVREAELPVFAIPGACAAVAAYSVSGILSGQFHFEGFLPHKKGRKTRLEQIASLPLPVVLYESPHRLARLLKELVQYMGSDRPIHVLKELTKMHEQYFYGKTEVLLNQLATEKHKGEFVIITEPGHTIDKADKSVLVSPDSMS